MHLKSRMKKPPRKCTKRNTKKKHSGFKNIPGHAHKLRPHRNQVRGQDAEASGSFLDGNHTASGNFWRNAPPQEDYLVGGGTRTVSTATPVAKIETNPFRHIRTNLQPPEAIKTPRTERKSRTAAMLKSAVKIKMQIFDSYDS